MTRGRAGREARVMFCLLVMMIALFLSGESVSAGGYFLTDKDGNVVSEELRDKIIITPTDREIVLTDTAERKVFAILWSADERAIVVRGKNVHMKIHHDGRIEKWTESPSDSGHQQWPVVIQPVVPAYPPKPK